MINLRYHIVSITAVFLALGIGVALGSTFLDRATVDRIDDNISSAENEISETRAENNQLEGVVEDSQDRDEALIEASGALFDDQLTAQAVLMVVAPGVDQATVDALAQVLDQADADVRGSLALRDDLTQSDEELDADLVEAMELDGLDPAEAHLAVYGELMDALAAAGAPEDTDDSGLDGEQPEVVTDLLDADLMRFNPGPGHEAEEPILEQPGYRYVYLTQPDLDPAADQLLVDLLPVEETSPALPAIVVSVTTPETSADEEEPPPSAVVLVRSDEERSELYSTVDDIDTFMGMWSTVSLLAADEGAAAAHYGQGEGATALMPAAT